MSRCSSPSDPNLRWIPLESNPEVLNGWAKKAGLVISQDQFHDIYGLDPELLSMVPQPVKAVILLFPITDNLEEERKREDVAIRNNSLTPVEPTVIWIKQTISNACGTIGLLHSLMNSNITFSPGSPLAKFIDLCKVKLPDERARLLETTPLFSNIHSEAAHSGQSVVPTELDTDLHFTCLVQTSSVEGGKRLVELDGRRAGPIDRGPSEDLLKDVAKIIKDSYIAQSSSIHFSMMALAPPA